MRAWAIHSQDDIPEYSDHTTDSFFAYGTMFAAAVRKAGAEPVLFMAWGYARLSWATMDAIAYAHRQVCACLVVCAGASLGTTTLTCRFPPQLSTQLGVKCAPVGLAMRRSLAARPDLDMLGSDAEHETLEGSYLGAAVRKRGVDVRRGRNDAPGSRPATHVHTPQPLPPPLRGLLQVIYMTIHGGNATSFSYVPEGVAAADAAYLRGIAEASVAAWANGENK